MEVTLLLSLQSPPPLSLKPRKWLPKIMKSPCKLSTICEKIQCNFDNQPRRSANYQPTLWTDDFIQSLPGRSDMYDENNKRIEILKKKVVQMFHEIKDSKSKLQLVDHLQQLGVDYHFNKEIDYAMWNIFNNSKSIIMDLENDHYSIGLLFRLCRQYGFDISEDIFNNCKDEKGNWRLNGEKDVKGLLSLYEASFLAKGGDIIMDEARFFTIKQLRYLLKGSLNLEPSLKEHVEYSLELPIDWRMKRLHHRWFINAYTKEKVMNPILLELAILDYNAVQALYIDELKQVSRWWTNLGISNKLFFIRDRLVENYFWALGFAFEPQYQYFREVGTKIVSLITTVDDIYDVYGTIDELEVFTNVINRWDVDEAYQLPEYMKIFFLTLSNTVSDIADKVMKQNGLDIIPHIKRAWIDLCNAQFMEAKWYHQGYKPKFNEYIDNALTSLSSPLVIMHAYCVNEHVSQKDLWGFGYPSITRYSSIASRFCDDLATSKDELKRGDVLKSIQCYMHEKGVSETIARNHIKESIEETWKQVNEMRIYSSSHDRFYKEVALDFFRMSYCIYLHEDGYAKPDQETKKQITSLFIEPIKLGIMSTYT